MATVFNHLPSKDISDQMRQADHLARLKTRILSLPVAVDPSPMTFNDLCYIGEIDAPTAAEVVARCLLDPDAEAERGD